jgi:ABC-type uncharacterized transport system fused permease/ATPase subunit
MLSNSRNKSVVVVSAVFFKTCLSVTMRIISLPNVNAQSETFNLRNQHVRVIANTEEVACNSI